MSEDTSKMPAASSYGAINLTPNSQSASGSQNAANSQGEAFSQPVPTSEYSGQRIDAALVSDVTEENFEETVLLSQQVPVLLELWTSRSVSNFSAELRSVVAELDGQIHLARIDVDSVPAIAAALQIQEVPALIALVGGQPVPLFVGEVPRQQIVSVLTEVLQVAQRSGVSGRVRGSEQKAEPKVELPPLHQSALEAEAEGNLELASTLWSKAITTNPRDAIAKTALADVNLRQRLAESKSDDSDPLALADNFAAAGNMPQAFEILLEAIAKTSGEEREEVRNRLVDLFLVAGNTPEVSAARSRLATLLF